MHFANAQTLSMHIDLWCILPDRRWALFFTDQTYTHIQLLCGAFFLLILSVTQTAQISIIIEFIVIILYWEWKITTTASRKKFVCSDSFHTSLGWILKMCCNTSFAYKCGQSNWCACMCRSLSLPPSLSLTPFALVHQAQNFDPLFPFA